MPSDIKLKDVWCPFCDITFDPPEGDETGTCPECETVWWLDTLWMPGWGPPVNEARMRSFKGVHSHGPNWYSVEWEEE